MYVIAYHLHIINDLNINYFQAPFLAKFFITLIFSSKILSKLSKVPLKLSLTLS